MKLDGDLGAAELGGDFLVASALHEQQQYLLLPLRQAPKRPDFNGGAHNFGFHFLAPAGSWRGTGQRKLVVAGSTVSWNPRCFRTAKTRCRSCGPKVPALAARSRVQDRAALPLQRFGQSDRARKLGRFSHAGADVVRVFVRELSRFLRHRAKTAPGLGSVADAHTGAAIAELIDFPARDGIRTLDDYLGKVTSSFCQLNPVPLSLAHHPHRSARRGDIPRGATK